MPGQFYVFINYEQAARFGHVGWGVRVGEDEYFFGSTDHLWKHDWWDLAAWLRYMDVPPDGDIDWWVERGSRSEMLETMRRGHHQRSGYHIRYHAYKAIEVPRALPERAIEAAHKLRVMGWNLSRHNCVHQTFMILSEYCEQHDFPNPVNNLTHLIPKRWFQLLPGKTELLI